MRGFFRAVLIGVAFFVLGCNGAEPGGNSLREIAKVRLKASGDDVESSLTRYARSNGLKLEADLQKLAAGSPIFLIGTSEANESDISSILSAVFKLPIESKVQTATENGKSVLVEESTTKVRQLTLLRKTRNVKAANAEFVDVTVYQTIHLSGKLVYKGIFGTDKKKVLPKESTSLNARQLLSLLKDNGLEVKAIAYAGSKETKGCVFSLRIVKK